MVTQDKLDVRAAVAMMRELGVTRLRTADMEIELGPTPGAPPVLTPVEDKPDLDPVCRCGHPFIEHNEAGCGHGCDLDRCVGAPQHPEPEAA